jgi:CRP/FNR family transcriptional regulator, cyclic AMP receptor protein
MVIESRTLVMMNQNVKAGLKRRRSRKLRRPFAGQEHSKKGYRREEQPGAYRPTVLGYKMSTNRHRPIDHFLSYCIPNFPRRVRFLPLPPNRLLNFGAGLRNKGGCSLPLFVVSATIPAMAESRTSPAATLAKVQIFAGLTENELSFLAPRAVSRHYTPGQIVFSEGEPCAGMYVVESGHVRVFKSSANGREQVLTIDGPGSSVAELPVFDGGNYPASVAAVDDTTLLFISKQDFQTLCLTHPHVALKVLRVVGGRLRRLVGIIEELSFTTVRHRLASYLLRSARHEGKRVDGGIEITLPPSNQELASQIGTVRELVSRNLSRLQSAGLIRIDGRSLIIPDLKALEGECVEEE